MDTLTIGQLAKRADVNLETIRYYERRGLMPRPPRSQSGYRQYASEDIARIRFIKHAQRLGFTLKEISELLYLRVEPNTSCAEVKRRTESKIAEIEEKIQSLEKMKRALTRLAGQCRGRGPTSECPILDALEEALESDGKEFLVTVQPMNLGGRNGDE